MFAGPLGRSTFTPPKSSFDSPLYGLVSLRRSQKGSDEEARIAELERMVGRLTMENALLKKALARIEEQRPPSVALTTRR